MEDKSALIAMSGGVDSSVSAHLMVKEGYRCEGVTMRLFTDRADADEKLCGSNRDIRDADAVAQRLDMPYHVLDCTEEFREKVMETFVRTYEMGETPSPCIDCNRCMKFGRLLEFARERGLQYVVTGHYARVERDPKTGRYLLRKAADPAKDQSYFLYTLTQDQLAHILFPLGGREKTGVRELAGEVGMSNAKKKDSQDICFVPDGDYVRFMEQYRGKTYPQGDFLDREGNVVGRHRGAVAYTIGQRKGLGLAMGAPVYVCSKNMQDNTVTVGPNQVLFASGLRASDVNWVSGEVPDGPFRCRVKIRSRHAEEPAQVWPEAGNMVRVVFDSPQRAISPGQAVVFYDGDIVLGGGRIREQLPESDTV